MSTEKLTTDDDILRDAPRLFVVDQLVAARVSEWCAAQGRTRNGFANNLITSFRRLGKRAVNQAHGPRCTRLEAARQLQGHVGEKAAREHVRALEAIGLLLADKADAYAVVLRHMAALAGPDKAMWRVAGEDIPQDAAYWAAVRDAKKARKRALGAARVAKHRRASCPSESEKTAAITIDSEDVTPPSSVTSLGLPASPAQNPFANANTKAAAELPKPAPVEGTGRRPCARARARACRLTEAEILAVEAELAGLPKPAKEPSLAQDPEVASVFAKWEARAAAPVASLAAAAPKAVKDRPRKPARKVERKASIPALVDLVSQHWAFEGSDINILALANTGLPLDTLRQAIDLTAEAMQSSRAGRRKAVRCPGAFMVGTARKLANGWRGSG